MDSKIFTFPKSPQVSDPSYRDKVATLLAHSRFLSFFPPLVTLNIPFVGSILRICHHLSYQASIFPLEKLVDKAKVNEAK